MKRLLDGFPISEADLEKQMCSIDSEYKIILIGGKEGEMAYSKVPNDFRYGGEETLLNYENLNKSGEKK
jgi:hypothetical protein